MLKKQNYLLYIINILLIICILFSGCTYSKNEINKSNKANDKTTQPISKERKYYSEEEILSLSNHNKFPKSYLLQIGDGDHFTFSHYDEKSNTNSHITAEFNNATAYTNISKLDKENFDNYQEEIAPLVDKNGNFKTYKRTTTKVVNGGLDEEKISTNEKAQRELVLVDAVYKNNSDNEVSLSLYLMLQFHRYKSYDDEFVTDEFKDCDFEDEKGNVAFADTSVYFSNSMYKNMKSTLKRTKEFATYTFKPHETLKCQLGYLIDKDLENAMFLSPTTGTQLELQVFNNNVEKSGSTKPTTENATSESQKIVEDYVNTINEEDPMFLNIDGNKFTVWFEDYNRDFRYDYFDKNNDYMKYFNFAEDFLPIVEKVDESDYTYGDEEEQECNRYYSIKSYTRYTYLDNKLVDKSKVNRNLHTLQLKIWNNSDKEVTLKTLPEIKFIQEDSSGNQSFVKNKVYKDESGKVQKETTPIYVYPSANQSSKNYKKYCSIKFKPKETKVVSFRYILDNDLYNSAYFCLKNAEKDLYKKLSYDYN